MIAKDCIERDESEVLQRVTEIAATLDVLIGVRKTARGLERLQRVAKIAKARKGLQE